VFRLVSIKMQEALRKAADAAEKASQATDPEMRAFYQTMEGNWLRLAASYDLSEKNEDYLRAQARSRRPTPPE
jgi:hypothetical protein